MDILRIFSILYIKTIHWSRHQHAPYYLAGLSFAESSFFPIPPDVMLISMGLARPQHSWRYAFIATLFSVIGGIFGYFLGYYGIELIEPYILSSSYAHDYQVIKGWFDHSGIWVVVIAAFTPLPYKLFTLTAGAMQMALLPFIFASLIGRGLRFFLVSAAMYFMGERLEHQLRRYVDITGWAVLGLIIIIAIGKKWVTL